MAEHRIYGISVASVYRHYVTKAEKKGRSAAEVDEAIRWQTGYEQPTLTHHLAAGTDFRTFFCEAPAPNPARALVTGKICGVRIEEIEDPLIHEIRITDKLVDEIARGRPMAKVLRG